MKKKIIWLLASGLIALALLTVACYSAATKETTPVAPATPTTTPTPVKETTPSRMEISGFTFVPATITVAVGTTVTWTNKDSVVHTVSSQDTLFGSGNLSKGATFSYTFSQPGAFEYRCKIHPSMKGKVVVGAEDSGSAIKTGNGTADY